MTANAAAEAVFTLTVTATGAVIAGTNLVGAVIYNSLHLFQFLIKAAPVQGAAN
jgi:hypothetical protein